MLGAQATHTESLARAHPLQVAPRALHHLRSVAGPLSEEPRMRGGGVPPRVVVPPCSALCDVMAPSPLQLQGRGALRAGVN